MTQHDTDMTSSSSRVTVEDAAKLLGVSIDAVRKRIERGTLKSEKPGKTRYVLLEDDEVTKAEPDTNMTGHDTNMTPLVSSLQEQVGYLRVQLEVWQEEARRKDHIIAALTERIPELEPAREAAPEPREESEASTKLHPGVDPQGDDAGQEKRSWWQWLLGA